jgi:hypothetical protein
MKREDEEIPGYSYGLAEVASSPVSMEELAALKISAGFTEEDKRYLRLAGEVLRDQTEQIVHHWRSRIIASIPESRQTFPNTRGGSDSGVPGENQRAFSTMDSGYVPAPLRPGLDQLPTGNCGASHELQKESGGRCAV